GAEIGLADSLPPPPADCSAVALPDRRRRLAASLEAASARLRRARQPSEEADAAKARLAAFHRLNEVTDVARLELLGFRKRWLLALCGRLVDTGEMRIRHARSQVQLLKETIDKLRND
uniref:BAG domain-containing protein n=1 Tax=Macrostomum lignano TaxID=282301 RepID=A0A1I8HIV5_9PLAT